MFPPPLHRICRVSIRPTDIGRDGGRRRRMVMETASIYPFNVSHPPPPPFWRERAPLSLSIPVQRRVRDGEILRPPH